MKFDWFRSYHGAPTDPKWLVIAKKADAPVHVVVSIVWMLLDYSSQNADRGNITGFDEETASVFLGVTESNESNGSNVTVVTRVIAALKDKNIVNFEGYFSKWDDKQGNEEHRPLTNAERQKRLRESRKAALDATRENVNYVNTASYEVIHSNEAVTESNEIPLLSNGKALRVTNSNAIEIENKKEKVSKKEPPNTPPPEFEHDNFFRNCYDLITEKFPVLIPANTAAIHAWQKAGYDFATQLKPVIQATPKTANIRSFNYFTHVLNNLPELKPAQKPPPKAEEMTPEQVADQVKWYRGKGIQHQRFNPYGEKD